jgi:hydrogenase expression/formation protein HypC
MCLAVPGRLARVEGDVGFVEFAGAERRIGLMLLPDARVGDYVLVHAGYAIQRMDEAEATETLRLLDEAFGGGEGGGGGR